jgi:hypothetical protein
LWRSALWLLLVSVLVGRVAAMPGWMPVAGADGVQVMLCNGGSMVMPLGKANAPSDHKGAHDCPFAAAAHHGGPPAAIPGFAMALPIPVLAPIAHLASIIPGRALALPPSTGPPALA